MKEKCEASLNRLLLVFVCSLVGLAQIDDCQYQIYQGILTQRLIQQPVVLLRQIILLLLKVIISEEHDNERVVGIVSSREYPLEIRPVEPTVLLSHDNLSHQCPVLPIFATTYLSQHLVRLNIVSALIICKGRMHVELLAQFRILKYRLLEQFNLEYLVDDLQTQVLVREGLAQDQEHLSHKVLGLDLVQDRGVQTHLV